MNPEKLKKLQAQAAEIRIGGKGMPRRKKKIVHTNAATDDKKLQSTLKKLAVNNIAGIEEVNLIKNDGSIIHFNNPRTQASLQSNVFAITGHAENKNIADMLPSIINHLGTDGLTHLKRLASEASKQGEAAVAAEDTTDIPELIENFENAMNKGEEESKVEQSPKEVVD